MTTERKKIELRERMAQGALSSYALDRRWLVRPNRVKGTPGLRRGVDSKNQDVLIKAWICESDLERADLKEIWRNEIRQLHRLRGTAGAADLIVDLIDTAEDQSGFYLVLDPGLRIPLESIMTREQPVRWLDAPTPPAHRVLIWQNLRRIALGLGLLHAQGLLHRALDRWAILASGVDEPDFQLTGFEWSIRLVGVGKPLKRRPESVESGGFDSFLKDWEQLGRLCTDLFGINEKALVNLKIPNHEVATSNSAEEIRLVREMRRLLTSPRLDSEYVVEKIDRILASLILRADTDGARYHLGVLLGATSPLARTVREASGDQAIEMDDWEAQLDFIKADLSEGPVAISQKLAGQPESYKLLLQGTKLTYDIQDLLGRDGTPSNWKFAACSNAASVGPMAAHVIQQKRFNSGDFEILPLIQLRARSRNLSPHAQPWELIRSAVAPRSVAYSAANRLRRGLWLTQIVEYLFAVSDVFPVEVVAGKANQAVDPDSGRFSLYLRPREEKEREQLSRSLLLKPPAKRLRAALLEEDRPDEGIWTLTDGPKLGERSPSNTEWRFADEVAAADGQLAFRFVGEKPAPLLRTTFLIPSDSVGRDYQLRRRLKCLKVLEQHWELARMLSSPRDRILKSEERVEIDDDFKALDGSKQQALKDIVATVPLFMVQGPPGVGKTRLVRDLVRRSFRSDSSTRILLSAQSNYAVDHLLEELKKVISTDKSDVPLTVRCRSKDKRDEASPFDVGRQASAILANFSKSKLAASATESLKAKIEQLAKSYSEDLDESSSKDEFVQRAYEGLILRSANAVFATTNSADLERLIEEKGQFDWALVEESGKATGGELLAPLLLSHRRLMIGDHKQLAPFGSEGMLRLFEAPKQLHEALTIGNKMIGQAFRDVMIDEIFADIEDAIDDETKVADDEFVQLCLEAGRVLLLFEALVEAEFARQDKLQESKRVSDSPIARRLAFQHRMHPAIARVVSNSFYKKELKTDPEREAEFLAATAPVQSFDKARLPDCPLVWVDMPWVQNTKHLKEGDVPPVWQNPDEVKAVLRTLWLIRARKGVSKPSLAVLSPYTRQIKKIERDLSGASAQFSHLAHFSGALKSDAFCHTVDSFQGSEADVVIVSLVRNNQHSSIRGALGFLSEARRMNVLLSRARWKLIVIGSLSFLEAAAAMAKTAEDAARVEFLANMLEPFKNDSEHVRKISYAHLCGAG